MRRFFKTVSIVLLCGTLCCPVVEGRGRNNGQGGSSQSHQSTQQAPQRGQSQGGQRPGNNGNQQGNQQGGQRPGNNGNQQGNQQGGQRPGNNGNHQGNQQGGQRPGNNGNHQGNQQGGQRPGNNGNHQGNQQGGQRPGNNGNHQGNRPGGQQNQRPGNNRGDRPHSGNVGPATPPPAGGHGHGTPPPPPPPPGHGQHPNYGYGYPHRPNLPPPAPWQRPTPPPPGYRPYRGPSISTILGVALGTTIYYALDNLSTRGYNVVGYGNDAIYLNNVTQLGMNWPDATLYYVNGQLAASEFVYGQGYYDMTRYYNAYGMLASSYGYPTSTSSYGQGGQRASWWSPSGQFITLTYAPAMDYNGNTRYYTTLSFGN